MMLRSRLLGGTILWFSCAWLACGSESFESTGSGSGGGGSAGCVANGVCFVEGDSCQEPGCCPCRYECRNGRWSVAACPDCAAPACPSEPPADGDGCDPCSAPIGEICAYERCGGAGLVSARCLLYEEGGDGVWKLETSACEPPPPCGEDPNAPACPEGQICVKAEIIVGPSSTVTYGCEQNPCSPLATDCSCAQPLCEAANAPLCIEAGPRLVTCENGAQ